MVWIEFIPSAVFGLNRRRFVPQWGQGDEGGDGGGGSDHVNPAPVF